MENTIENAMKFAQTCDLFTEKGISSWYDVMVAYASQTAPKLVLPKSVSIDMEKCDYGEENFWDGYNHYESELIRLNPHITDPGSPK